MKLNINGLSLCTVPLIKKVKIYMYINLHHFLLKVRKPDMKNYPSSTGLQQNWKINRLSHMTWYSFILQILTAIRLQLHLIGEKSTDTILKDSQIYPF